MRRSEVENPNAFQPTETWHVGEQLVPEVAAVVHEMNQIMDPRPLIIELQKRVKEADNGVTYAVLKGDNPQEYSTTDALVVFNPFANGASPNMLVRAEFIRRVARHSDVRDADGKLKPVIMLASPTKTESNLQLDKHDMKVIRRGNLGPAAAEYLHALSTLDVGIVALLGFSQGADMAFASADAAYAANLDTTGIAVGDPAGVEKRGWINLGGDFMKAGPRKLDESIGRTRLTAQQYAKDKPSDFVKGFLSSALTPVNRALWQGMGKGAFETRAQELLDDKRLDRLVIAYGGESKIAKPKVIEPMLQRLAEEDEHGIITSIRVDGANHTWGDQLTLLAKLYMKAVA